MCTLANRIKYCAYNQINWIIILGIFEKILRCIHNLMYIQKQKPSTFKSKSKNLQHLRTKVKTCNI
jgi:hypothetical protein